MVKLEHKKYGSMGGEFILHHHTLQPKRLMASLVVTTTLTAVFDLHEMVTGPVADTNSLECGGNHAVCACLTTE